MSDAPLLVIRGGTVVDGSGRAPYEADVVVKGDKIVDIGTTSVRGDEEIDARHLMVMPGLIDPHTHYDAQVTWTSRITPSSWNGVTTAMMGNCGVGFAPCAPEQREMLVELMEGVEDIPEPVLTEGLPWKWETFPEYLNFLQGRQYDIDFASQVPHAALRVFVMGQRGLAREPATAEDREAMSALAAEGIRAGALGVSTSRTLNHKTVAGMPIPTLAAAEAELSALASGMARAGSGWLQLISDFDDVEEEFSMLRRVVEGSRRPMTISLLQRAEKPEEWRRIAGMISQASADGLPMTGQVITRATGVLLGFEVSQNPFMARPSYRAISNLPFDQKIQILQQPEFRTRLLAEDTDERRMAIRLNTWDRIFPLNDPPNYEPPYEDSVAAHAARAGVSPEEMVYDMLLANGGHALLYRPLSNYAYGNLDTVHDMISHADTLIGLGDGGAHVSIICDSSALAFMLTHWTRDRTRGARFPMEWAVKRLTSDNARALGLNDRGVLSAGDESRHQYR